VGPLDDPGRLRPPLRRVHLRGDEAPGEIDNDMIEMLL
jgi:hypothetical protein